MLRFFIATGLCLHLSLSSFAQLKKFYTIKETSSFDTVNFTLKASSGNSFIKNYSESNYPMVILGNPDLERINPSFNTKFTGKTCFAKLDLEAYNSLNFGDGFAFVVAKKNQENDGNYWKILVNQEKVYQFNMNYGVGNTEVDLSNVKTDKLKLKTGSANVKIGYQDDMKNLISMDTFYIKMDMGTLETTNIGNARASNYVADIGFGTALLDFGGERDYRIRCDAKVGAGSLDVLIPNRDAPVIIYVKGSPFCGIRMADDFEEVEEHVYVNKSYSAQAKNLMTLDVDLAVGTLSISYAE